jgi:hypothetical protein
MVGSSFESELRLNIDACVVSKRPPEGRFHRDLRTQRQAQINIWVGAK